jgi:tetratricopeptide (TPR) repeat protein
MVVNNAPVGDYTSSCLVMASTIHYNNKNYREALGLYQQLQQVSTEDLLEAQIGQMRCHYLLGETEEAATFANAVINNNATPEDIKRTAQLWRGRIRMAQEDYTSALVDFKEVLKKGGAMAAESKYSIAFIYNAQQDYEKCEKECFELIEKFSAFDEWKFKGFLLLADNYVNMNDLFNARATLDAILENVDEPWVLDEANKRLQYIDQLEAAGNRGQEEQPEEINIDGE